MTVLELAMEHWVIIAFLAATAIIALAVVPHMEEDNEYWWWHSGFLIKISRETFIFGIACIALVACLLWPENSLVPFRN